MIVKGAKVGTVEKTLPISQSDSFANDVSPSVGLGNIGAEVGTEYVIDVYLLANQNEKEFAGSEIVDTWESQPYITLPAKLIKENGIKPGYRVSVEVYEAVDGDSAGEIEQNEIESDDGGYLDTVSVRADDTQSDGIDCRLKSKAVYDYIGSGEELLKFKNTRTGDVSSHYVSRNSTKSNFSFPIGLRQELNVEPGDKVLIYRPGEDVSSGINTGNDEMVSEIHEMVTVLYNAYVENND